MKNKEISLTTTWLLVKQFFLVLFFFFFIIIISTTNNCFRSIVHCQVHENNVFLEYYIINGETQQFRELNTTHHHNINNNEINYYTFEEALSEMSNYLKSLNETELFVNVNFLLVDKKISSYTLLPNILHKTINYNCTISSLSGKSKFIMEGVDYSKNIKILNLKDLIYKGNINLYNLIDVNIINCDISDMINTFNVEHKVFISNSKLKNQNVISIANANLIEVFDSEIEGEIAIVSDTIIERVTFKNCTFNNVFNQNYNQIQLFQLIYCKFTGIVRDTIIFHGINNILIDNNIFTKLTTNCLRYLFAISVTFDVIVSNNIITDNNLFNFLYADSTIKLIFTNNLFTNNILNNHSLLYFTQVTIIDLMDSSFINNHVYSSRYSLISVRNSMFNGNNLLFENCTTNYNGKFTKTFLNNIFHFFNKGGVINILDGQLTFVTSKFLNNKAVRGGAIYGYSITSYFNNCLFEGNIAEISGGAVCIERSSSYHQATNYYNNKVNDKFGLGGALYLNNNNYQDVCASSIIDMNTTMKENKGYKGGAIYLEGPCFFWSNYYSCNCSQNKATCAGGAIYFATFFNNQQNYGINYSSFKENIASIYGNNIASDINNISQYKMYKVIDNNDNLKEITKDEKLTLYPGEILNLKFYNITDFFGNTINALYEDLSITTNNATIKWKLNTFNITTVTTTEPPQNPSIYIYDLTVILKDTKLNIEEENYLLLEFNTFIINISYTLIPTCPNDYILEYNENYLGFICSSTQISFKMLLILIILSGSLVFIIGLIIGISLFYGIIVIVRKIRKLHKKERAEREMNKKMNSIIINEEITPLLKTERKVENKKKKVENNIVIPIEDIKVVNKIAEGGNGVIYYGLWKSTEVAIKSLKATGSAFTISNTNKSTNNNLTNNLTTSDTNEIDEFEKEATLLAQLRHPNIVNFYGISFITKQSKYMIVEYMKNGDLGRLIYNSKIGKEKISLKQKINLLLDISNGMNYLHDLKPYAIIHRDLKPGNILLDDNRKAKVCDFGVSKIMSTLTFQSSFTTNVGTLFYMPPESFIQQNSLILDKVESGRKVDIYSFGIIMWELLFEENPYCNQQSDKLYYFKKVKKENIIQLNAMSVPLMVIEGKRPIIPFDNEEEMKEWIEIFIQSNEKGCDDLIVLCNVVKEYINLFTKCWSQQPNERPNFTTIISQLTEIKNMLN